MSLYTILPLALGILLIPQVVQAQIATALLREGDLLSTPAGHQVTALNNTAVDHGDGFAVTLTSSGASGTLSQVWGSHTGGTGEVLRTEAAIGTYIQTSFESFFGISTDPACIAYSASATDTLSGATGLDGVWMDDLPVAVERSPYPHQAGMYWSFGSRPGATADGVPHWVGGITSTPGGSTENRGLFWGTDATPLLLGGDVIGGLPHVLSTSSPVSFDYRFSAQGTHYIAEVQTVTGSTLNDNSIVIDGAVLLVEGQPVTEASPVPAAAGGLPGEAWDSFDFAGITESGEWMFTGDTDADAALDEIIVQNGMITYREGDIVDGELLGGAIEGAYLNADGDVAFIWDIQGGALEALFLNGQLILQEGDAVDFDGDLVVDPYAVLDNFTGISSLTLSDRDPGGTVRAYFTADVSVDPRHARRDRSPICAPAALSGAEAEEAGLYPEPGSAGECAGSERSREILEATFLITVQMGTSGIEAGDGQRTVGAFEIHGEPGIEISPSPVTRAGTTIRFAAVGSRPVRVDVVDVSGRPVRQLAGGRYADGWHTIGWDACDDRGQPVPAAIYLVRMRCGDQHATKRITVLR